MSKWKELVTLSLKVNASTVTSNRFCPMTVSFVVIPA